MEKMIEFFRLLIVEEKVRQWMLSRKLTLSMALLLFFVAGYGCGHKKKASNTNSNNQKTTTASTPIRLIGRAIPYVATGFDANISSIWSWPGVAAETYFSGQKLALLFGVNSDDDKFGISLGGVFVSAFMDGNLVATYNITETQQEIALVPPDTNSHHWLFIKENEAKDGSVIFYGPTSNTSGSYEALPSTAGQHLIEFIGESVTAGYGDLSSSPTCASQSSFIADPNKERASLTYGFLTAQEANSDWSLLGYTSKGLYLNNDGSMTNTLPLLYAYDNPVDIATSALSTIHPDIIVINLGLNDLAAITTASDGNLIVSSVTDPNFVNPMVSFKSKYVEFIQYLQSAYSNVAIVVVDGPMVEPDAYSKLKGKLAAYQTALDDIVSTVGSTRVSRCSLPFNPGTDSAGRSTWGCDYHPNALYQQVMQAALLDCLTNANLLSWK